MEDFERGALPDICVATGRPADGRSEAVARTGPGWGLLLPVLGALVLNVVGFVAGLVILSMMERRARGWLPWTAAVSEMSQRASRRAWEWAAVTAFVTAGVMAFAVAIDFPRLLVTSAVAGGLVFTGFALRAARPPGSVKLRLASDSRWVEVRNAAPDFVSAYEDQLRLQPR